MRSMRGAQLQSPALRFAVTLVIVCILSIATAGSSHAQVPAVQVEVMDGGPVFDIDNLYPGASTDSTVRVTNLRAEPGNLTLSAVDIVDESKCSPAENRAGMPCGGGIGALGAPVGLTIEHPLPGGGPNEVWTGAIYPLINVAQIGRASGREIGCQAVKISE